MKMKYYNLLFKSLIILVSLSILSCSTDDESDSNSTLQLNITGLEDLGAGYAYEGWIIVNGNPVTTGVFTVDGNGALSQSTFNIDKTDIEEATTFVLTIEPSPDSDAAPSDVHILAGEFSDNHAAITVDHSAALNADFAQSSGVYILATPTDGPDNNENSGIWFLDNSTGSPEAGLSLPTLPNGWVYEGWAVVDGTPVSTGTFTSTNNADDAAPYSGSLSGPPFPGEDLLLNAPGSLSFPISLEGGTAVISIEPVPDNSPNPFTLKPLVGMIPANSSVHTPYGMDQNLTFPTGTVTR